MRKLNITLKSPLWRSLAALPAVLLAACGSELPERGATTEVVWLEQNWSAQQRAWFHHADQGTETFLIPREWLTALEQPGFSLFGTPELFMADDFMAGLGFIPDAVSAENPHGLPVGFATGNSDPARPGQTPVGLTCAACHTGHMTYQGTSLRYDGGPAMIAPDALMLALLRSMVETAYNKRQFTRFARRVLGEQHSAAAAGQLQRDFSTNLMHLISFTFQAIEQQQQQAVLADIAAGRPNAFLQTLAETLRDNLKPSEGFGRTDALTRIGNQVFALDIDRPANFVAPRAPVSFPFIWSSSWFIWVQYDGSIMQPMVRNAGEALGVGARLTLDADSSDNFASSVRLDTLHAIERQLAGSTAPFEGQAFTGLVAPQWPEQILGSIDRELAAQGAALYQQHCQRCHLPAPDTTEFWDARYWRAQNAAGSRLLDLPLVPVSEIGTDAEQSAILARRRIDASDLGIATTVSAGARCEPLQVTDGSSLSYAFALGAVVQEVVQRGYEESGVPAAQRAQLDGYLPNCLQAPEAYKARPLDGIWATAPYLHNGSVPDLLALLSPLEERPARFWLGNLEFDPQRVGYVSTQASGLFELDTTRPGNANTGHEFAAAARPGVIGPLLQQDERLALLEYLKTL